MGLKNKQEGSLPKIHMKIEEKTTVAMYSEQKSSLLLNGTEWALPEQNFSHAYYSSDNCAV